MKVIDGQAIAQKIERLIVDEITSKHFHLALASLFIGEAADSALYTRRKAEAAKRLNVLFTVEKLSANIDVSVVEQKIKELNMQQGLDGYIMQLPLPEGLRAETNQLINLMEPKRDVDGLTEANRQRLLKKEPGAFLPTPVYAVMNILASLYPETKWEEQLQFNKNQLPNLVSSALQNKQATIISNGDVFGQILKFILEDGGVATYVVRSDDPSLYDNLKDAKLIITAVGQPKFLTGEMIQEGAIVIDVGTTLIDGKTVGDADWSSISKKASAATPVPGGVGPVTVAMLYANLLYLKQISNL